MIKKLFKKMKCIKRQINSDYAYLIPLSDAHIGDVSFDKKLFQGYIDWINERENALVFLNGDIVNVATRESASSTFEQVEGGLSTQLDMAVNLLYPIREKIIGAITGNHEQRMEKYVGWNPTQTLCMRLGIPYCGYSAILNIDVISGKYKREKCETGEHQNYIFYCHHTTGGGGTIGGKLNRVAKLKELVANADCYIGSHNHQLGVVPIQTLNYNKRSNKVEPQRQLLVDTGSFLRWDNSYAEMTQLPSSKLGAVRIRLDGIKHDIHCDL